MTISPSSYRYWTPQENEALQQAISLYNSHNPKSPFPSDQFNIHFSFSDFTKKYLPGFPKSSKQIRERCITRVFLKARTVILESDKETIKNFYKTSFQDGVEIPWKTLSKQLYIKNNEEFYYPGNTLKNFIISEKRQIQNKREVTSSSALLQKRKKTRTETPTDSSLLPQATATAPLARSVFPFLSAFEVNLLTEEYFPVDWPL